MKKSNLKIIFGLFSILFFFKGYSQTETFKPKGSFSVDMGIPAKPQNPAFERTMEGLANIGIDFRYNVYKGLTFGLGFKYSLFSLNSFAFKSDISGGYQMPGAFLHIGYEKFTTDRVSFTGSIRGGYSMLFSFNEECEKKHGGQLANETFFVEPQIEMVMLTDKVSAHGFSMVLGYSFYFYEFGKEDLCVDEVTSLNPESYEGITRFLSIGFGYRYYMGRR